MASGYAASPGCPAALNLRWPYAAELASPGPSPPLCVGLAGYGVGGRGSSTCRPSWARGSGSRPWPRRTRSASQQARSELPDALVVPDLDALLEVDGLDLVVLATPTGLHAAQAERVIEAGVALVVDKPLADDRVGGATVVDLAAHHGVPLTVFQNRRFDPELAALLAVRDHGLVGEIRRAEYRWDRWRPVPKQRWRETQTAEEGAGCSSTSAPTSSTRRSSSTARSSRCTPSSSRTPWSPRTTSSSPAGTPREW